MNKLNIYNSADSLSVDALNCLPENSRYKKAPKTQKGSL